MKKIEFQNKKNLEEWAYSHSEDEVRIINSRNAIRQGLFIFESINSESEFNIENMALYGLVFYRYLSYFKYSYSPQGEIEILFDIQSKIKNRLESLPSSVFTVKEGRGSNASIINNIEHSISCSFPLSDKSEVSALYDTITNFPYILNAAYKEQDMKSYSRAMVAAIEYDASILNEIKSNRDLFNYQIWPNFNKKIDYIFNKFLNYSVATTPWNYFLYLYRKFLIGEYISDKDRESLSIFCETIFTDNLSRSISADHLMEKFCGVIGWDWKNANLEPIPAKLSEAHVRAADQEGSLNSHEPRSSSSEEANDAPAKTTHTPLQSDGLAEEDWLERRPLARTLARRIKDFYARRSDNTLSDTKMGLKSSAGLAINLTAPWGEGKSSVLNMLDSALREETEEASEDWLVIHFNAWDHERRRPPWWAMIETLYQSGYIQLRTMKGRDQHAIDFQSCWRRGFLQSDWALFALGGLLLAILLGVGVTLAGVSALGNLISLVSGAAALATTAYISLRGLVFGDARNANFHFELKRDPLRHSRRLFESLIKAAQGPICICIDDLDRCDADFVVDLLEGIQTAFRHPDVVYVVAADRKWIKAAFEHRYTEAFGQVPTLGNPLGYLFVDKIFQDSITLQPPPEAVRVDYWHKVIGQDELAKQASDDARLEELKAQEEAEEAFKDAEDLEGIQAVARQASEDTNRSEIEKRAFRTKAFEAVAQSSEARRVAEHAFKNLHAIIPFNPRALKRLSNTLTLRMAEEVRSGQRVDATTLARWVVLEFSYPELADLLYENPEWANYLIDPEKFTEEERTKCEALRPYVGEKAIRDIFEKTGEGLGQALSADDVFIITQGRPGDPAALQ